MENTLNGVISFIKDKLLKSKHSIIQISLRYTDFDKEKEIFSTKFESDSNSENTFFITKHSKYGWCSKEIEGIYQYISKNFNSIKEFHKNGLDAVLIEANLGDNFCDFYIFVKNRDMNDIYIGINDNEPIKNGSFNFILYDSDYNEFHSTNSSNNVLEYIFKERPDFKIDALKRKKNDLEKYINMYKEKLNIEEEKMNRFLECAENLPDEEKLLLEI